MWTSIDRKSTRLKSSHLGISCAVVPRDLRSSPTRRSSDLNDVVNAVGNQNLILPAGTVKIGSLKSDVDLNRSEEHTSEIQSLRHIVCRRPPGSPLFPYPPLFRSERCGECGRESEPDSARRYGKNRLAKKRCGPQ